MHAWDGGWDETGRDRTGERGKECDGCMHTHTHTQKKKKDFDKICTVQSICIYIYIHTYKYLSIYVCMYACIYIYCYIYMCFYIPTNIPHSASLVPLAAERFDRTLASETETATNGAASRGRPRALGVSAPEGWLKSTNDKRRCLQSFFEKTVGKDKVQGEQAKPAKVQRRPSRNGQRKRMGSAF